MSKAEICTSHLPSPDEKQGVEENGTECDGVKIYAEGEVARDSTHQTRLRRWEDKG
jgi:hypothetical protein